MEIHALLCLLAGQTFFPVAAYALPGKLDGSQDNGSGASASEKRQDAGLERTGVIRVNQCSNEIYVTPHETEREPARKGWQLFRDDSVTPEQVENWDAFPIKKGESVFILYNERYRKELDSTNSTVHYCPTEEQLNSVQVDLGQLPSDQEELEALIMTAVKKRDLSGSDVSVSGKIEKRFFPLLFALIPAFVAEIASGAFVAAATPFVLGGLAAGVGAGAVIGGSTAAAVVVTNKKKHKHDHDKHDGKHN